mmetsp:Transcript_4632/g.15414  ORF Transcript_4632/g.15414 Transcript_4632/m.15414 type:complete len:218 (-) Transcript_4632:368-1021(-)
MTVSNLLGANPKPAQTPPREGLEDVTNGYVPKSKSSIVALAPSTNTRLPALCSLFTSATVSWMYGVTFSANTLYISISASTSYSKLGKRAAASFASALRPSANLIGFRMSPTRTPLRVAFEAYAGPIPRLVVPILFPESSSSRKPSTSLCRSNNMCARSLITRRSGVTLTPAFSSASSSLNMLGMCTTTPLPTTQRHSGFRIPEGTKCKAYLTPLSS